MATKTKTETEPIEVNGTAETKQRKQREVRYHVAQRVVLRYHDDVPADERVNLVRAIENHYSNSELRVSVVTGKVGSTITVESEDAYKQRTRQPSGNKRLTAEERELVTDDRIRALLRGFREEGLTAEQIAERLESLAS